MIISSLLLMLASDPCTNEQAYKTPGHWVPASDDTAMADRTFPRAEHKTLNAKADRVIELLKKSIPDITGLDAKAYRSIRGDSYVKDGPVKFGVNSLFLSYYCVPAKGYAPSIAGTVQPGGETGTWIYVDFNSLNWLANERMMFTGFKTTKGNAILLMPKSGGTLRGFELLLPDIHHGKRGEEAMVLAPEGKSPYKPLSREKFLLARQAYAEQQKRPEEATKIAAVIAAMSPEDREAQAVVKDYYALDPAKIFVPESGGGTPLATISHAFFDVKGSRSAIRMITLYWSWDQDVPSKVALIKQFKENFDFEALKKMIEE